MSLFGPNIANLKAKRDVAGLLHALKSKDTFTRGQALLALGELGDARAAPAIADWLLAKESTVHEEIAAVDALRKLGNPGVADALVRACAISQQREQELIADTLKQPDKAYRAEFYINRIATDEYTLRTAIAQAIAAFGGARALTTLFELLVTEKGVMESNVKQAIKTAISELTQNADAELVALLRTNLGHASPEAREWAAHCLGELEDGAAMDALLARAADDDEVFAVREAAFFALGNIGDASILPELEHLTRSSNRGIARDAKQCWSSVRHRLGLPTFTGY